MVKVILRSSIMTFLAMCCAGYEGSTQEPARYNFPSPPPIWIVESDPKLTIFERKDLQRDRKVGKMLVIPLYRYFRYEDTTDFLAIAHPFVYQQGEDIEKQLASLGQRDKLRRLIFWVPGYFPDGLGQTFPWVPIVNGKRMVVLELQPTFESERDELKAAMKTLLLDGDFVIEEKVAWKVRPPRSSSEPTRVTRVDEPYDFTRLVRSTVFPGRFFKYGTTKDYVLWAFNPGTKIVNRLSPEEKKIVAEFARSLESAVPGDKK